MNIYIPDKPATDEQTMSQTNTYNRATETVRATVSDSRKLAGVCFFVLSAQFVTAIMLAAAMAPDYDFGGGAISDLGVFAETALLFNASLVVVGVLNLLGGFLFYRAHGKRWLLAVFTLASIGAVGAGCSRSTRVGFTRCSRCSRSCSSTFRRSAAPRNSPAL